MNATYRHLLRIPIKKTPIDSSAIQGNFADSTRFKVMILVFLIAFLLIPAAEADDFPE
jgi:hypothetical protein